MGETALRRGVRRSPAFVGQATLREDIVHCIGPHFTPLHDMLNGLTPFEEATRGRGDDRAMRRPPRPVLARLRTGLAAAAGAGLLAACALPPLRAGMTESDVRQLWGVPGARHALPGSGVRLEYASGPYGKVTWMVDLDETGRLVRAEQVLDEAHFARVGPGMTAAELLRLLGRPADRMLDFQRRQTWSWRYESMLCQWFRVTLSPQGTVLEGGAYMTDPMCEPRDPPERR